MPRQWPCWCWQRDGSGLGATVAGFSVLIELGFLEGRAKLNGTGVHTVMHYGPS